MVATVEVVMDGGTITANPNCEPPYVILNSKGYDLLSIDMKMRQHDCISQ